MTRLDATSEPSMEDILASIRKIIAEDPPGSRAALGSAETVGRASVPSPQAVEHALPRSSARDSFSPSATATMVPEQPAALDALAIESHRASDFHRLPPAALDAEVFFAKSSAKALTSDAPIARVEPSFAAMAQPLPAAEAVSAALSVEEQLSDLLGDALPATATSPTSALPDKAAAPSIADQTAPGRSAAIPSAATAPIADSHLGSLQDARQSSKVSYENFVSGQASSEPAAERDPFDFDLGPSPFEVKSESKTHAAPVGPALGAVQPLPSSAGPFSPFDLGGFVPVRTVDTPLVSSPAQLSSDSIGAAPQPAASADGMSVSPEQGGAAVLVADKPAVDSAAPSVAATIAPETPAPSRPAEPIARFVPANASIETPKSIERDVLEVVAPSRAVEVRASAETFDRDSLSEMMAASASVPMTQAGAAPRTMEDTVAELLRPMLRTWLAENMPRIVERALRRELTDQLGGDKQEAAE